MRIALLNRTFTDPGGDQVAILALKKALEKRSHYVWYAQHDFTPRDLKGFDIAHVQHCQFPWALENIAKVREAGLPYVLVPMWYTPKEYSGYPVTEVFSAISKSSMICPFSSSEAESLYEDLVYPSGIDPRDGKRFEVIPNGTSTDFTGNKPHSEREGVIAVAARPGKGEAHVEAACKELGLPFHFVTGLPHEAMPSVYRNARVFVNASGGERMSLTTGEALCSGCRVIDTVHNWGNEWYPGIVRVDPEDNNSLRKAIAVSYGTFHENIGDELWDYSPNAAALKLTWDHVASLYEGVYERCLVG